MINNFSIIASLVAVGFIAVRAAFLDKLLPWFKPFDATLLVRRRGFRAGPGR